MSSNSICVIGKSGERLMPSFRPGRVRHLLKDGKAKIVKHQPFTIQLLYDSNNFVQPIELCEDVGYKYIGISAKSKSHEYVSAQYDTLADEKKNLDDRRKYRRTRRNRLRYREPRFDNRRREKGCLAPSLRHKKELNVNLIKTYVSVMPISRVIVEVGSFDTTLLSAIAQGKVKLEGVDYQQGPRYNIATLREAVFFRDDYKCVVCGRSVIKDTAILHVHHVYYWKGRHGYKLDELAAVCEKCHTPANHQKDGKLFGFGEDQKFKDLSGAAFMNTVRWQIVQALREIYPKDFVQFTYGAMTKAKRIKLKIPKTHNNDAYVMGDYHPSHRCAFTHYQKKHRNNRILEKFYDASYIDARTGNMAKGKELFNGRINRNHKKDSENLHQYRQQKISKGYRAFRRKTTKLKPGDIVCLDGEKLIVHGTHTSKTGNVNVQFKKPSKTGKKSASLKKLAIIKTTGTIRPVWERVLQ